jgi:RimJ/RimL family protein N-acetyltransferase
MGDRYVHLCVTREWLVAPQDLKPVRWIVDSDAEAFAEPLHAGQDRGWTLEEWLELQQEGYVYCGRFLDGRLCALAGVWKRAPDVWEVIAVHTRDGYTRKGLAKAVARFAADHILNNVQVASYTTTDGNVASIRTAQSVGFRYCTNLVGREKWCAVAGRPPDRREPCPLTLG